MTIIVAVFYFELTASNNTEPIFDFTVEGIVGGTIPPLAILAVILGLIGFMCGWKMRSSFTRSNDQHQESVALENQNASDSNIPVRLFLVDVHCMCSNGACLSI